RLEVGAGIPGRVFQTGELEWISNLADPQVPFVRSQAARRHGICSGLGVPVHDDEGNVIAALLFFSRRPRNRDDRYVALATLVAGQVGQVLARKIAEKQLRATQQRYATLIE